METVCFRLPGHGDTTLKHMNSLRFRQHFCDITIVASNNQTFKGHKVVLAACSPFLRDQFLLNPSSRLQVSVLYSSSVVCDLLQSCYTGMLQFSPEEIVNYLTAASYFQMEHIVERCRGALEKYVQLKNPSLQKVSFPIHFVDLLFLKSLLSCHMLLMCHVLPFWESFKSSKYFYPIPTVSI
ncbi:Zinc finger and BTB domain-containing protein 12 [Xenoophorus captivus]|uniref:Zinc finger and BTB domain-containing protein 12 n=1 Tax=Xenoophorus captivus TaxID=1517983 RepID=A0ABV0RHC2_9TELE